MEQEILVLRAEIEESLKLISNAAELETSIKVVIVSNIRIGKGILLM